MDDVIVGDIRVLKLFDSVDKKVDDHREKNNFVGGLQDELVDCLVQYSASGRKSTTAAAARKRKFSTNPSQTSIIALR